MKKILYIFLIGAIASSCVSTKIFNAQKAEALRLDAELAGANTRIGELVSRNNALSGEKLRLEQELAKAKAEFANMSEQHNILVRKHGELEGKYDKLLNEGSAEAARMLRQLEQSQKELNERSRKVDELNQMLKARDEAINAIRRKVTDALLGFEGKGLSISTRDGKVYVSMDDKLLFKSGSFEIDPNGAKAVKDLATVLAQNPDINVMVEGHTDDVPYPKKGFLDDNLDLSVKRATTVVRLLLSNKDIASERIIASGRGESVPVDVEKTSAARTKNRRTEIILTPKLDELLKLTE